MAMDLTVSLQGHARALPYDHKLIERKQKVVLYGANWEDAKDDDTVFNFIQFAIDTLDQRAKIADMYYDFVWLNDAAPFQKKQVFLKYGGGRNYPKLKQIARKYGEFQHLVVHATFHIAWLIELGSDPYGVFQKLLPGGFKL